MKKVIYLLIIYSFLACNKQDTKSLKELDDINEMKNKHAMLKGNKIYKSTPDTIYIEKDNSSLDTTLIRLVDLTGDSIADTVVLNLHISSWNEPVSWELYIVHDHDTLYRVAGDDARIDKFYGDPEFMYQCDSYLECKKKWYLEQLINFRVEKLEPGNRRREIAHNYGKHFAEMENSEYGLRLDEALANWQWLWEYYADKPIVTFEIRTALESSTPVLTFHSKLGKFVPIYHP